MFDLPRLHRKVLCGLISSQEIAGLFQTYSAIQCIMNNITKDTILAEPYSSEQWLKYVEIFRANFTEEKAQNAGCDITAFNTAKYKEIGEKEQEIQETLNGFQILRREIAKVGGISEEAIRLESREKEPFGFKASTINIQQLKKNQKNLPDGTKFSELKSGGWIDCNQLQKLNTNLQKQREVLENLVKTYLLDACLEVAEAGQEIWTEIEQWVSHIDCTQCIGRIAKENAFTCPLIEEPDENGSAFDIKNIRHPLVEASSTRVSYVKHNVALGGENAKGWTVYGMNASGKSTLMKATGLCVLLAQAGCFVPAKEMMLRPFKAIYTRILNQDNLFAGLSSFAVEMSELRDILRNANKYTLVLGDELCAGTESVSAQALVASGIQWLSEKNAKFIFATHLHDLPNLINTKELGVEVWHLHVDYDPVTKKLVYDRSLRPGSGSTLYGLEVARAMDLPFEFIEQALKNRHRIIGSTTQIEAKTSSWNTFICKKECEICKKQITSSLEVHHIKPRKSACDGVLEDGTNMNDKRNLIVICNNCHDKVHNESIVLGDVKMTSDGPDREIVYKSEDIEIQKIQKRTGKWSNDEICIINETLKKYSTLSLKSIRAQLSSKHGIEISEGVLGKMRKDL
jgi:DNA mismatch repair ATPase MutS